jgi:hypothetical protein
MKMKSKSIKVGKTDQIFYPDVIEDQTGKLVEDFKRNEKELLEKIERQKTNHDSLVIQRQLLSKQDKYIDVLDVIIEWFESGKSTIPCRLFNFQQGEMDLLKHHLNKLIDVRCFANWKINPLKDAEHSEIVFEKINIDNLYRWRTFGHIVVFKPGSNVLYENKIVFFKTNELVPNLLDFRNATDEQKLFECFWDLWSSAKKTFFSEEEVIQKNEELFGNQISRDSIKRTLGNFRRRVRKSKLTERLDTSYNKKNKGWNFVIS